MTVSKKPTEAALDPTQTVRDAPRAGDLRTVTLPNNVLDNQSGRWSALIASPRGVMILVPALVLALGLTLTIVGQVALGATSKTMAQARFVERTEAVGLRVEQALQQSSPLLDELERIARSVSTRTSNGDEGPRNGQRPPASVPNAELTTIALEMRDLLVGRQAITQAYIAFSDGRFLSADTSGSDGLGFQSTTEGQSRIYHVVRQSLVFDHQRTSNYDPRVRDWFRLAQAQRDEVWSSPYAFFFNQHPGVTRALPLYLDDEKTELLAVVGVDFDVDALTRFMADGEGNSSDIRSVVFTLGGFVLAFPSGAKELRALPKSEQVATHQALRDPELSALIEYVQTLPEATRTSDTVRFLSGSEKMIASVRKVGAGGPDWYVATFSSEASVLSELYAHRERSLLIGTLALTLAMGVGWLLARHILRVKKIAHAAREAVERAHAQVRDLGSYRLISLIGEGGMGEVWRARHRLLARQAAIKLIKSSVDGTEKQDEQRERFRREAQAIAGLRSRNTVALFDYGVTAEGALFYVMELLDGIDLSTLVSKHGAQPAERVRKILIQACNSLAEAHAAQLVHRDIKPANLFLCREAEEVDVVKVLDFGLVFQQGTEDVASLSTRDPEVPPGGDSPVGSDPTGRITRTNHQLGTPAFMSPEQALGHETDARSDLYSLACVAWWLLTGDPPFSAPNHVALMLKHIETPPGVLASRVDGGISTEFEALILACLEKSPSDRPQSAQELGRSLRKLGEQSPGWDEEQARAWWEKEVPENPHLAPNLSLPPLRGTELLPPKAV